jgi:hypothetical protein
LVDQLYGCTICIFGQECCCSRPCFLPI